MNHLISNASVRVRIAPSPTGIPHIGNTRTALFNYLFAKHNNGVFIVRIEDTDRARFVKEAENAIYEILRWLGLQWDEEHKQSGRLDIYKKCADQLLEKKLAYKDEGAIRFKMPKTGETSWTDLIGSKNIVFKNELLEDFIIIKSDGYPTYNFANVVDDHLMNISHVIRGDEFISSTPKHLELYNAFRWKPPLFAHLPVIVGSDKQKLSKRHGAKSVLDYRKDGFLKEAVINFMALLGWNPGEDKEILSIEEMIKVFDLKDVNTSPPVFDLNKLTWFNGYYIRHLALKDIKSKIKNQKSKIQLKIQNLDDDVLDKLIELAQTRIRTLNDFEILCLHFFEEPKIELNKKEKEITKQLIKHFSTMKQFNNSTILEKLKLVMIEKSVRMPVLYRIMIGRDSGLPLPESLEILGKEKTLKRLKRLTM